MLSHPLVADSVSPVVAEVRTNNSALAALSHNSHSGKSDRRRVLMHHRAFLAQIYNSDGSWYHGMGRRLDQI